MLKELIKKYLSSILKEAGFRKTGLTWNRNENNYTFVIDIQPKRVTDKGSVDFTVNIGIFMLDLWNAFWATPPPKFIKEENCYPRFRLGYLLSNFDEKKRDKGWSLQSEEDIETIGEELSDILIKTCLPFFNSIQSVGKIRKISALIIPRMPIEKLYRSILLHIDGDRTESKVLIDELMADAHWGNKAKDISTRLSQKS